ncbi:hypothetical protein PMAYCL1PPCAC_04721, partial [Pristionchus mayeri]
FLEIFRDCFLHIFLKIARIFREGVELVEHKMRIFQSHALVGSLNDTPGLLPVHLSLHEGSWKVLETGCQRFFFI